MKLELFPVLNMKEKWESVSKVFEKNKNTGKTAFEKKFKKSASIMHYENLYEVETIFLS